MAGTQPNNDVLLWGRTQRLLAGAQRMVEQASSIVRMGVYGELVTEMLTSKQHKLSDEGSYFLTRSPTIGTGIATIAAANAFADTSPFIIITNNNPVQGGRNIYLDYIILRLTVAGTSSTDLQWAIRIDNIPRWSSGGSGGAGTGLTTVLSGPYPTNTGSQPNSAALIYCGAIVAVAGSTNVRTLGNGKFRTAIAVVNDSYLINFAGVDMQQDGVLVSGTNIAQRSVTHPPVCIGPQGSLLLHLFGTSQAAATSCEVEIGHVER